MKSRTAATAAALLLAATLPTAFAFQGTFPLLAISSTSIPSLSALVNPSHRSITPFAPDSTPQDQTTFNPSSDSDDDDDDDHLGPPPSPSPSDPLCSLSQIILINAPGLHHSDLAHLKDSLAAIQLGFGLVDAPSANADAGDKTVLLPYLKRPHSQRQGKNKKSKLQGKGVEGVLKRYLTTCDAALSFPAIEGVQSQLWAGDEADVGKKTKKVLKIVGVEGLDEWELTGQKAREMRKTIMDGLDNDLLHYLPHPTSHDSFLLLITDVPSLPSSFSSFSSSSISRRSASDLRKRQSSYSDEDEAEIEQALEDAYLPSLTSASELEEAYEQEMKEWMGDVLEVGGGSLQKGNGTTGGDSIFKVDKNSGLLHRYIFFTPPLIFSLLISLLILIPVVTLTANLLTTTQTVHGLETKMTGSVGLDPSKA